jgi:dienelactone hydrolase
MGSKQSTPECCPPGSLATANAQKAGAEGPAQGTNVARPTGEIKAGVLMFHDVFGVTSGRTCHVADFLATSGGYLVVVPTFFVDQEVLEHDDLIWHPWRLIFGGVAATFYHRMRLPWSLVEAKVKVVAAFMQREAGQPALKIGALGMCWGACVFRALASDLGPHAGTWAASLTSAMDPCPIVCAANLHPSPQVQKVQAEGPTMDEMLRAVKVPQLLAPSADDADFFRPDGWYIKFLNESGRPTQGSESFLFADQKHGWSVRGAIHTDPVVRRGVRCAFVPGPGQRV